MTYQTQWWKRTVFYQIYMPSFADGNHDGIGDFKGICEKLPYLKKLGVGGIWLTPFYPSPKADQGYDISDYYNIDPDYGTMEDFEMFLERAHELEIRVIADMVINHTSTGHPWFLESKSSRDNPKRDWYIWKEAKDGREPNNWESFFGEKAWAFDETTEMYYYHSFAREQADLNWANPQVKTAIFEMLDFWADKGLDGFRLDVINNLSLTDCMTDNPTDASGAQIHAYDINQPGIHDFMRTLKAHFEKTRPLFLVGEISSDQLELIHSFTGSGQLDTTFNFNLGSQETFDFGRFYGELSKMTDLYSEDSFPTIFFGSHDMPRYMSRFGFDIDQAKSLMTLMMTYRAVPFIYFGDEIAMANMECASVDDARDIQGIIAYRQAKASGMNEEEALRRLNAETRDHSRNTMYWDDSVYGGFSDVMPWIGWQKQPGDSAGAQMGDRDSMLNYTAALCRLRSCSETLAFGSCSVSSPRQGVIICRRQGIKHEAAAVINFSEESFIWTLPAGTDAALIMESASGAVSIDDRKAVVRGKCSGILYIR